MYSSSVYSRARSYSPRKKSDKHSQEALCENHKQWILSTEGQETFAFLYWYGCVEGVEIGGQF